MNIPPLISRTPPPISDVVDEGDEEDEDDDITIFPRLNFCDETVINAVPDDIPSNLRVDTDETVSPDTDRICSKKSSEKHDYIDHGNAPSKIESIKQINEPVIISCYNHVNSIINNSDNKYSLNNVSDDSYPDIEKNCIQSKPPENSLSNTNNDVYVDAEVIENAPCVEDSIGSNDLEVSQDHNEVAVKKEGSVVDEFNIRDLNNQILSDVSEHSFKNNSLLPENLACDKFYDDVSTSQLPLNNDGLSSKEEILSVVKDNLIDNHCFCVNECSCVSISSKSLNDVECSDEIEFQTDVPSKGDTFGQDHVSSQFSTDFDVNFVSSAVTKENGLSSISDNKSFPPQGSVSDHVNSPFTNASPKSMPDISTDSSSKVTSGDLDAQLSDDDDGFSDFVECTYNVTSVPETVQYTSADPYRVFVNEFVESKISPALLLCLNEELRKTSVWNELSCLENTPALNYRWDDSYSSTRLLSSLKIDSRNILSGHWTKSNKKVSTNESKISFEPHHSYSASINKAAVTHPQFDWFGSGLINPLAGGNTNLLDLQLLSFSLDSSKPTSVKHYTSSSRHKKSIVPTLSSEAENIISSFPDLYYLKQSFIVFPKNYN